MNGIKTRSANVERGWFGIVIKHFSVSLERAAVANCVRLKRYELDLTSPTALFFFVPESVDRAVLEFNHQFSISPVSCDSKDIEFRSNNLVDATEHDPLFGVKRLPFNGEASV